MASAAGPRIVVTRRIPDPALELLHEAGGEVWVSPHDRPMTTEELHAAVAGADAIVTLLHDRVDDGVAGRGRKPGGGDRQRRGRLRQRGRARP